MRHISPRPASTYQISSTVLCVTGRAVLPCASVTLYARAPRDLAEAAAACFERPLLLHDGRAKTLREVLTKHHNPDALVGKGELTPAELDDLIAYLDASPSPFHAADSAAQRLLTAGVQRFSGAASLPALTDSIVQVLHDAFRAAMNDPAHLAELAKSFEKQGHKPKIVAEFLTRCLFCMFAEDVGLVSPPSLSALIRRLCAE